MSNNCGPAVKVDSSDTSSKTEMAESEFIVINGIATQVLKYGAISKKAEKKFLFLIIPGNPGVAEYYEHFMQVLYENSGKRVPVWAIAHTGHVSIPKEHSTTSQMDVHHLNKVCSLEGQVQNKVSFIRQYIPKDVSLILIGHSIGCYMIIKMLEEVDQSHVHRCFLLFPTIERMKTSPNGIVATPILKYLRWLVTSFVYCTSYLSPASKYKLLAWYFKDKNVNPCILNASMHLFDPLCAGNAMYMAHQEMQTVDKLDVDLIQKHLSKLSFYYGQSDRWCPKEYCHGMRKSFFHGDIRLCEKGFSHAFVIDASREMADTVWEWLHTSLDPKDELLK
ncbi:hypothetical protein ACJMK2_002505 [Sinanodonta woodiana]|uniref:Lipid droplet-associated hydrolase n=1 Tax=Sinanodonta woodiana TaxID=1069815 RepID=A0ABD3XYZ1_SINWO